MAKEGLAAELEGTPEGLWWERVRAEIARTDGRRIEEVDDREVICLLADALDWDAFLQGGR